MNTLKYFVAGFAVGFAITAISIAAILNIDMHAEFMRGKVEACEEFISQVSFAARLQCEVDGNDVVITSPDAPGRKLHLNGREE